MPRKEKGPAKGANVEEKIVFMGLELFQRKFQQQNQFVGGLVESTDKQRVAEYHTHDKTTRVGQNLASTYLRIGHLIAICRDCL